MADITRTAAVTLTNQMLRKYKKAINICQEDKSVLTPEATKIVNDYESNGIDGIITRVLADESYFGNYDNDELYAFFSSCRKLLSKCKLNLGQDIILVTGVTDTGNLSILSDVYKCTGSQNIKAGEKVCYNVMQGEKELDSPLSRMRYAVEWQLEKIETPGAQLSDDSVETALFADSFENTTILFNQFDRSFTISEPGKYKVTANIYEKDFWGRPPELVDIVSYEQVVEPNDLDLSNIKDEETFWNTLWGALQGEFNENPTGKQILIDMGLNFIPGVGQLCDARDITACLEKLVIEGRVNEVMIWVTLLLTAIGCIPYAGDVVKAGCKAVIKGADDAVLLVLRKLDAEDVYKGFKFFKGKFLSSIDEAILLVDKWIRKAGNSKYGAKINDVLSSAEKKLDEATDFVKKKIDDFEERIFGKTSSSKKIGLGDDVANANKGKILISRDNPIVQQIEKETSSDVLKELAAKNNIKTKMASKIKEVGWTEEIFAEKIVKPISTLTDEELLNIKKVNEVITNPTNDTLMSKVISEKAYLEYISNGERSSTVFGCVTKAADVAEYKTYEEFYEQLGLHYEGTPYKSADKMYIIRYISPNTEKNVCRNFGGTTVDEKKRIMNLYGLDDEHAFVQKDPFVGNGATKTPSNEYGSIEFNAFKPCKIEDGAAIYELGRTAENPKLVAVRHKNQWYTLGEKK